MGHLQRRAESRSLTPIRANPKARSPRAGATGFGMTVVVGSERTASEDRPYNVLTFSMGQAAEAVLDLVLDLAFTPPMGSLIGSLIESRARSLARAWSGSRAA